MSDMGVLAKPSNSQVNLPDSTSHEICGKSVEAKLQGGLVPFQVRRLRADKVIYRNEALDIGDDAAISDRFGFLVQTEQESSSDFVDGQKTFFAERYGGRGIGSNGGGARCGLDGDFQVKGIGPNPLVGRGTTPSHAHGELKLVDALQEALWGEVLNIILPHGAIRVPAIIATGTSCVVSALTEGESASAEPRALAIREAALRVGHFERAPYFRPLETFKHSIPRDVDRMHLLVQRLPELLPQLSGDSKTHGPGSRAELLSDGLLEFVRRTAEQLAVSKSRRIMHGAISSSNLCLDGRWIDYGSVSALPGFATLRNFDPSYWEDHSLVPPIVDNLCYFIRKYSKLPARSTYPDVPSLVARFNAFYQDALRRAFADLCGMPRDLVARALAENGDAVIDDLGEILLVLARSGTSRVRLTTVEQLQQCGDYKLGPLLVRLADARGDMDLAAKRIRQLVPDDVLRERLLRTYYDLSAAVYEEAGNRGIAHGHLSTLISCNARKINAWNRQLFHDEALGGTKMARELADCPEANLREAIRRAVDTATGFALASSDNRSCLRTLCWRRGGASIFFDAVAGQWIEVVNERNCLVSLERLRARQSETESLSQYQDFFAEGMIGDCL